MTSHDLCIVHLSDLHFAEGVPRPVFEHLIQDLGKQIKNDRDIAFVVTGDLVSKGRIKENEENVLHFFKGICDVFPPEANLLDVEIVPGNHDGVRADKKTKYNNGSYLNDLSDYEHLSASLYGEFGRIGHGITSKNVFGNCSIDFYGRRIEFVRLDTSSFEFPKKLREQIADDLKTKGCVPYEKVEAQFKKQTDAVRAYLSRQVAEACRAHRDETASRGHRDPDLVIVLSHHPLSILNESGYDNSEDTLFKNNLEFDDVWISGHTHQSQQYFTSDNMRQRVMLTTGIGWQESPHELLRYSIYRINLDRNTCQVTIQSATANEDFSPDKTTCANQEFALYRHLTLPLKLASVGAAIHAHTYIQGSPCGLYADFSVIEAIPKVLEALRRVRSKVRDKILTYGVMARAAEPRKSFGTRIRNLFDGIGGEEVALRRRVMKNHYFSDLINVLCLELSEMLRTLSQVDRIVDQNGKEAEGRNVLWRVHARLYRGRSKKTITKECDRYVAAKAFEVLGVECEKMPSDIEWGGLIEAASKTGEMVLIDSANPHINVHETDWSDFMTIVPRVDVLKKRFPQGEVRPLLTFGISFKAEGCSSLNVATKILYLLEYLGVHSIIADAFSFFIDRYKFTAKEVVKELR